MIKVGQLVDSFVSVYITTFRVEKPHSSAHAFELAPFVMVTCLTKGFYNFEEWGKDMSIVFSAFFHLWFVFKLYPLVHTCIFFKA